MLVDISEQIESCPSGLGSLHMNKRRQRIICPFVRTSEVVVFDHGHL